MRIEGSDFLRDGSVKEPPSGGVTRDGEDGAVGIGGCGIGGCGVVTVAGVLVDDSPRPGGRAGSERSNDGIPLVVGAFGVVTGEPATVMSGTVGSVGTLMPNSAGSRSAAW